MSVLSALLAKELQQLGRARGALASAILLPALMLVVLPIPQLIGVRSVGQRGTEDLPPLGGLQFDRPELVFTLLIYPLLVTIAGLMLPSVTASHTIVGERERRSLELLIALPVSLPEILTAKLLSLLILGVLVTVPLLAITSALMLILGIGTLAQVALLYLVLVCALLASTCLAFVLSLLARDFRTANNLNGALFLPLLMLTGAILTTVPGDAKLVVLSAALLAAGALALLAGARWVTFERYLE